jgi:hypothetical protein
MDRQTSPVAHSMPVAPHQLLELTLAQIGKQRPQRRHADPRAELGQRAENRGPLLRIGQEDRPAAGSWAQAMLTPAIRPPT